MKLSNLLSKNDTILGIAERVSNNYPEINGACELMSTELKAELKRREINAKHCSGLFILDEPDAYKYEEFDTDEDRDEYQAVHDWVEVEGKILDISAKQFRKSVGEQIPDIVFIDHTSPLYSRYKFLNYYGGPENY